MDIPVPQVRGGRAGRGGLQGLSQGQNSTAFGAAEHVDIPVPRRVGASVGGGVRGGGGPRPMGGRIRPQVIHVGGLP